MTRDEAIRSTIARGAAAVADVKLRYPGALGDLMAVSVRAQTQAHIDSLRACTYERPREEEVTP